MGAEAASGDRRDRQLTIACGKFNADPWSGITYLRENGLLSGDKDAAGLAQFLHTAAGLSKKAIGAFLGRPDAFSQEVLTAFVRCFNFSDQPLLPSLRRLLGAFLLPGESQQIDRISDCFARHFCRQNRGAFDSADACAVLCNALLMLNTELHHPQLRGQRPDVERLVEMAQHSGRPILTRGRLQQLYDSLYLRPFDVPLEAGADDLAVALQQPERSGWLLERRWQAGRCRHLCGSRWLRRWFVLMRNHLCYFASRESHARGERPIGVLPLVNLRMQVVRDRCKKFCFELRGASGPMLVSEPGSCRREQPLPLETCWLSAESSHDMVQWMLAVSRRVSEQPPPTPVPQPRGRMGARSCGDEDDPSDAESWEYVAPHSV